MLAFRRRTLSTSGLLLFGLLVSGAPVGAVERHVDTTTTDHPRVTAVYAHVPPVIDGMLTDAIWDSASRIEDFWITDLDRAPTESTIVWLAYDRSHFYFAARCYDSRPDQIRMQQTKRSNDLWSDDYVAVGLDIEHQHRYEGEYVFRVSARGTQDERIPDGSASKVEWKGDWMAAARTDTVGWTAEWAVPLSMFNRPAGTHTIGLTAFRRHQRTDESIQWPNMGRSWDRTKAGDWVGIDWPHQERHPVFMPYVVGQYAAATQDSPSTSLRGGYVGLDMKYTTPHGITFVGSAYPDFRNVENEILGLEFSYSERYQRDRRPFFEEGRRYFPDSWMFYTSRRIEEIYAGGKLFGQVGNHRVGIITAYDRARVNHAAGQWYWQPVTRLEIENNLVWRHGPKNALRRDGAPMATDNLTFVSAIRKGRYTGRATQYLRVQSGLTATASDTGNGYNLEASLEQYGGNGAFDGGVAVRYLTKGFMPLDGLFSFDDADQREVSGSIGYRIEGDRTWLRGWGTRLHGRNAERLNGDLYRRMVEGEGWVEVYRGIGFSGELRYEHRPPYRDTIATARFWWNDDRLYSRGGSRLTFGTRGGTDYLHAQVEQGIHPRGPMSLNVSIECRRRDYPPDHAEKPEYLPNGGLDERYQLIGTVQYDITPERAISGRVAYSIFDDVPGDPALGPRIRRRQWNGYCTYRQIVRKGLDLFLIIGDPSADTWSKRIAVKAMVVL